ncbi:MAG: helix-turn-helix domain-containing protein [Clostridia bacterium]|nr:helix-turn-helix domain-containing protein [Clostridia bacterium]
MILIFDNLNDVLTVNDLYNILPIGKNKIYDLLNNKEIYNIKCGKKFLIPKQSVEKFLMQNA